MRMITFKANFKVIFGILLCLVGMIVMVMTFVGNHPAKEVGSNTKITNISEDSDSERAKFLKSFGWEFKNKYTVKNVTIPTEFNDVYVKYNEIQLSQSFDLTKYKGKSVKLYTYNITNYKGYEKKDYIYANILIFEGKVIGGDVCSVASNGFMHGFKYEGDNGKT